MLNDEPQSLGRAALAALDPVVLRALQRRSSDRFTSVDAMSEALLSAASTGLPGGVETVEAPTKDTRETIIVLPFRGLQEDAEVGFLQHGLPEGLTAALSSDARWRVLSNREPMRFDETADLTTIGRELRADCLLTGTFLRAGTQVRITAQLVSAAEGTVWWSNTTQHGSTTC